jgi:hypothetical protein
MVTQLAFHYSHTVVCWLTNLIPEDLPDCNCVFLAVLFAAVLALSSMASCASLPLWRYLCTAHGLGSKEHSSAGCSR